MGWNECCFRSRKIEHIPRKMSIYGGDLCPNAATIHSLDSDYPADSETSFKSGTSLDKLAPGTSCHLLTNFSGVFLSGLSNRRCFRDSDRSPQNFACPEFSLTVILTLNLPFICRVLATSDPIYAESLCTWCTVLQTTLWYTRKFIKNGIWGEANNSGLHNATWINQFDSSAYRIYCGHRGYFHDEEWQTSSYKVLDHYEFTFKSWSKNIDRITGCQD